jgi:hypothetical protein
MVSLFALAIATTFVGTTAASAGEHETSHRAESHTCGSTPGTTPIATITGTHTYRSLEITGWCALANDARITVLGKLTLDAGATLNPVFFNLTLTPPGPDFSNFNMARVRVKGDVVVGNGATLYLGCSPAMAGDPNLSPNGCSTDPGDYRSPAVHIDGSVVGDAPLTMALDGIHVEGSVISVGGGPGANPSFTEATPGYNFAVKDNTIDGNLTITGWKGGWVGAIRNTVDGDVSFTGNAGVAQGGNPLAPDSTEIATNQIEGNLICSGNNPAAQLGDSGGQLNKVDGYALGECATLAQ